TVTFTVVPRDPNKNLRTSGYVLPFIELPSTARMRSPNRKPARAAGESGKVARMKVLTSEPSRRSSMVAPIPKYSERCSVRNEAYSTGSKYVECGSSTLNIPLIEDLKIAL